MGCVPDEDIMNDSEGLCISGSNLKYLGGEIIYANLKKNRLPKFVSCIADLHNSAKVRVAYT